MKIETLNREQEHTPNCGIGVGYLDIEYECGVGCCYEGWKKRARGEGGVRGDEKDWDT